MISPKEKKNSIPQSIIEGGGGVLNAIAMAQLKKKKIQ